MYLCGGLLLSLVKLIQLQVLAGPGMEQGQGADPFAFHPDVLQHLDGFQAGGEGEEEELLPHLLVREGRDVGMHT